MKATLKRKLCWEFQGFWSTRRKMAALWIFCEIARKCSFIHEYSPIPYIINIFFISQNICELMSQVNRSCSMRLVFLKLTKFIGKHLCWNLVFDKVPGLNSATLFIKRFQHRCFPVNFEKPFRIPILLTIWPSHQAEKIIWLCWTTASCSGVSSEEQTLLTS